MKPAPQNARGFTFVELLAAMAIGTIILLAAASLLGSSGEGYERVGGSVATDREARALMSQLGSDLSSAVFHKDGVIENSSQSWPAARLGFLSLQPAAAQSDKDRIGDLCAVNYHIKDLPIGGKTVRCLMRGFRESKDTFAALEKDTLAPLFAAREKTDEPIAFGVVSFEARPKSRDASGVWIDWVKNDTKGPEAFDVRLVLARRELAGRLKTSADWDGAGTAGSQLGDPAGVDRNRYLEVYGVLIRFGNHETF
jgi:prepilin-type N-terminal cleavage/methylation domain-containing protein